MHENGLGVPQNTPEAERWFRRAAFTVSKLEGVVKQGAAAGQQGGQELLLATLFSPHRYPPQFDEALAWLDDLKQREGEAAYVESLSYRDGNSVPQDDALADKLLELAALRDYPQAAYELGLAKLEGSEEERDWPGGMVMLWRAAKGDLVIAQRELALRYREAEGDDLNRQRAFYWLLRARQNGDEVDDELAAAASDLSEAERELVVRNLETDYVYTP